MNILAIDIGNSDIVIGVSIANNWKHVWRSPSVGLLESEYFIESSIRNEFLESNLSLTSIQVIIISSVVPDLNDALSRIILNLFNKNAIFVGPELYNRLNIYVERPHEIGSDLVSNAYAATKLYKTNSIVVDFGTALTFTAVDKDCRILGVAIAPGIKLAMETLSKGTAQLPEVSLDLPKSLLGKNTEHAIQAGVLWGYVGMVKEVLKRLKLELGSDYEAIATGGLSSVLEPLNQEFSQINKMLTLEGLRLMASNSD